MKVLVVEDEQKIAHSLKKGLEQESYAVDVVYDGEEGSDFALTGDFDVIILDLMLPKIDGVEVCKRLRKAKIYTPILMLTAKGELGDKVAGLNSGADDYLVKPFAFVELLARVKALTRRPKQGLSTILTVGDLTLDTLSHEVKRNGENINHTRAFARGVLNRSHGEKEASGARDIKLSRKEFALLEYLMRHPQQVLTKDQIINNVWDYDSEIFPNTVEVYIGYLRCKIDKESPRKKPLIHTIYGVGYKLGEEES